jgi:uncharacterized GH25 family protein
MNAKNFRAAWLSLIVMILAAGLAFPQAGRGTARLSGIVTDANGNPIKGAQVTLSYAQGTGGAKHEAKTDKKGEWSFMGLGTGQWDLMIVMNGYEPYRQSVSVSQLTLNPKVEATLKKASL